MEITIQPAYQEPEAIRELLVEYTGMLLEQNPAFAGYLKQQNFAAELDNLQEKYGVPAVSYTHLTLPTILLV